VSDALSEPVLAGSNGVFLLSLDVLRLADIAFNPCTIRARGRETWW
jgi:hypothetical protein